MLIFVDDDIEAAQDWLKSIVESFEDPNVQLVGGRNFPRYEVTPKGWLKSFWIDPLRPTDVYLA